jgi:long-chain acyl-CoA synthetase
MPKAAMLSHGNFCSMLGALDARPDIKMVDSDVYLSYLPLPHAMDRVLCFTAIYGGASIWFFNGDVMKLKEDLIDVRPTIFPSVPRLYNKFYDAIQAKFNAETGMKKWLIDTAISTKLANL